MFDTHPMLLKNLIDQVETGKIQLPDFQRGWVWDDDRIKALLASIAKRFPIGAIMTLSSGSEIKFKTRPIEGVEDNFTESPDRFLLDGQQRLTSLYQALRFPGPVDTSDQRRQKIKRWYYVDMLKAMDASIDREDAIFSVPEGRKVTADFGRRVTRDLSTRELEYEQHLMPTERLMEPMDWAMGYVEYWNDPERSHPQGNAFTFFTEFRKGVLDNFTEYQMPVINLDRDTPKEAVCTVFEKVNTGGITLNVFELVTASFAAENFSLRDDWAKRQRRMHSSFGVLQGISGDQFLQAVALLKTQEDRRQAVKHGEPNNRLPQVSCRKRDILDLRLEDYQRWADAVESGFKSAAKFLHSQFVFTAKNVPYNTQLVPLASLYVELGNELEPANSKQKLERWYWSGVFGEVYGGTIETQFGLDLVEVAEYVRTGSVPTMIVQASFVPERLLTLSTRNSAAYKGLYALQMRNGAVDWRSNTPLSLATWGDESIDIHHIFPVAWCEAASPKVPSRVYNSVINKTPLSATTNRIIGGRAPSQYLKRLMDDIGEDKLKEAIQNHWLEPDHLLNDRFAESFVTRGQAMLKLIGDAMDRDLGNGSDVFEDYLRRNGLIPSSASIPDGPAIDAALDDDNEFDELGDVAYLEERVAADD